MKGNVFKDIKLKGQNNEIMIRIYSSLREICFRLNEHVSREKV